MNNSKANIQPFSFQLPQSEEFNQILLDNLDLPYVEATGDISQCNGFLKNFVQSNITSDTIRSLTFQQFDKIVKVCQQTMTYYTQNQEKQEISIDEKLQELQKKQEQLEQLKKIEKQHQEKQQQLTSELESLKVEAQKAKEQSVKNIIFKCHHCDKCFKDKESVNKHIQKNHIEKPKNDITNPEYLTSMLQQVQTQPQSLNPQQSRMFGNTIQSMPDPATLGSAGFQQLKQQQVEKIEAKQRRKDERRKRRELDREDRLRRIQHQEQQMVQFQAQMQAVVESKITDMIKLHQNVTNQQQSQVEQQKKLLKELEELKNMRFQMKEQSVIQDMDNQSKSKEDELLIDYMDKQEDLDMSQQSLNSNQMSKDQKLLISKNQQAADNSGMLSFHNYSETINSVMQIKQQNEMGKGVGGGQKQLIQGEMAHIGEIESDNDDENNKYLKLVFSEQAGEFLKPKNKKSEVQYAEIDYLKTMYHKDKQQTIEIEDDEEDDEEQEDLGNTDQILKRERQNILGDNDTQEVKEMKQNLYKVQQKLKEQS